MGWSYSYPDMSLEDVLNLVKGFVDILILASGYQSSGRLAHWDSRTIKNAFQWGLFFENLFRDLTSSDDYQDSVRELDAALSEITSAPHFPQGLGHLSAVTLSRARDLVLMHLLHTLPLRNSHLRVLLTGIIEMELDELGLAGVDCLNIYLNKLMLQSTSLNLFQDSRGFIEDSVISSPDVAEKKTKSCMSEDLTKCTIQELLKRHFGVLRMSSAELGLDVLSKFVNHSNFTDSIDGLLKEPLKQETAARSDKQLVDYISWNNWRSKNLSYLLDKRTVRLVSGAKMIFSVPKLQWTKVLERLRISEDTSDASIETVELLLLGSISRRWNLLLDHLLSISYDSTSISKQYSEVRSLFIGKSHILPVKEESTMEIGVLEYLMEMLGNQIHPLWKLSPVLAAAALPSWSPLFGLYLSELESQFKGYSPAMRCCNCTRDMEHRDCELAERIWCLHVFHVNGDHIQNIQSIHG